MDFQLAQRAVQRAKVWYSGVFCAIAAERGDLRTRLERNYVDRHAAPAKGPHGGKSVDASLADAYDRLREQLFRPHSFYAAGVTARIKRSRDALAVAATRRFTCKANRSTPRGR